MHTPGKACVEGTMLTCPPITGTRSDVGKTFIRLADAHNDWVSRSECEANAARLALGWNLLESGILELLLSSCDEFMQVNAKHEYEFESNEPRVYRQMHEAIVKARSILSQLPKE